MTAHPVQLGNTEKMFPRSGDGAVEAKLPETLPKTLPGVVRPQWVRCGRPNCRCASGRLHGPYHYRFWRERGRLRKEYVPLSRLDGVRAACEARRQQRRELAACLEEWRQLLALVREAERR